MGYKGNLDLECGQTADSHTLGTPSGEGSGTIYTGVRAASSKGELRGEGRLRQIETYPAGYPRFSALLASHDSFLICRRFANLRSRLLLLKQDKLAALEIQLEMIDRDEGIPLYLGSSRRDANNERAAVLKHIDEALVEYDALIERNYRLFGLPDAGPREVASLTNWVNSTGCIARTETAYLASGKDLATGATTGDVTLHWLETHVENILIALRSCLGMRPRNGISRDLSVHIFSRQFTAFIARVLVTPPLIAFFLAPAIACTHITDLTARLIIVAAATTVLVNLLSLLVKAKTIEMFVAAASYLAVMIVFISSQDGSGT